MLALVTHFFVNYRYTVLSCNCKLFIKFECKNSSGLSMYFFFYFSFAISRSNRPVFHKERD